MSVRITYFVHSTTQDNEKRLATGWSQGQLSELGLEQAEELRHIVSQQDFDLVISSDLKRAVDTAAIAFTKFERTTDERLREIDFGDLEKTDKGKIETELENYVEHPFPNGESFKQVELRIQQFLDDVKKKYDGTHIAIVAHQAPQLALDVLVKGRTWEEAIEADWRKTKSWQPGWSYTLV